MVVYLRPQTLFGNKFESYLNESKTKPATKKSKYDWGAIAEEAERESGDSI
jgi:hypothetical protein